MFIEILIIIVILLLILLGINIALDLRNSPSINPEQARKLIKQNYFDYIIDVRSNKEWKEGHLLNAKHMELKNLYDDIKLYDKNARYLLYCRTGKRAAMGMRIMKAMGFKNVKYLIGNYKEIKNVHMVIEDNKN